ncbi:DoxX family protein [Flavivirga rizhaonensis]|uniref:DoxX family protein n=1 Tax=Flavivirga rizhaonensis TaxID=2559571 RepID=A0A4S1DRU8_9FLAO|nr:DoxX family protein [Flavivirga rizhaonensis]TGV00443.1 DoxX family protein [Flavivirga rizhaonensis]
MKINKILYWTCTILLCLLMAYSASMYFTSTEMIKSFFESFNYPTYIVIPLAILKVLGIVMILWRKITWLTEWAYAGFFFDMGLATAAHYYAGHGILGFSLYGLLLIFPSYFLGKQIRA